ncbi:MULTISPECIES: hypothetical protein [Streptacidiphilus]|uniref:Aminoglycoside phosphotransferase domain-containing protein n=1 Tax=Streptacidiphilus cavernicola TaxID=3342716 RepID=A0ABV6V0J1_9ACTN|nr:hypothetical protein [Streptacidiphilus jeojiense]
MTRPDTDTAVRMRNAHHRARVLLGLTPDRGVPVAWGWRGRTLGQAVTNGPQQLWLRLASLPAGSGDLFWWDGATAARSLPLTLPRPTLHSVTDWSDGRWQYRAELYDRTPPAAASSTFLTEDPDLPARWWADLRRSLDTLSEVETDREAVRQHRLDRLMPLLLGARVETHSPIAWTTCHGDFHFANLCGPSLLLLDWEGWGRAPAGYDAARLHIAALFTPRTAQRVRTELAAHLDTPAGRFAELVVITELLEAVSQGTGVELGSALRARAQLLLGRRSAPSQGSERSRRRQAGATRGGIPVSSLDV